MRNISLSLVASAAALAIATPAAAAVSLAPINGPNLATQIHASTTDATNDATIVFGSTASGGQSKDVQFTANTAVHITDGGGFASISDANSTADFTSVLIDPTSNFTALQFSVQLVDAGYVFVDYLLAGSSMFMTPTGTDPFAQAANTLKDYQITATGGDVLSAIRITTCTTSAGCAASAGVGSGTGISLEKQNSITLASVTGPVPEPATWAMMLLGFGAVGYSMRRKRTPVLANA